MVDAGTSNKTHLGILGIGWMIGVLGLLRDLLRVELLLRVRIVPRIDILAGLAVSLQIGGD